MTRTRCALIALLLAACAGDRPADTPREPPADERRALHRALAGAGVIDSARRLVHLSRVCDLTIGGRSFAVVDVMELIPGAVVPRGLNRVVVLDSASRPVQTIEYGTARPLFCRGDRLYLFGQLAVNGVEPEGNVLQFLDDGQRVVAEDVDVNNFPGDSIPR